MPVTLAQITGATDALTLQRLSTQMQLESNASYEAERALAAAERTAAAQRAADSLAVMTRQAVAAEAVKTVVEQQLALQREVAAGMLNPKQELYLALYDKHLKVRLGPSVISSNTADTVLDDMVRDAQRMTDVVYPAMQAALDRLV